MQEEPDAALIAASLTDPVQFGAIFDRHATVLHRYLVRRLGPDDAPAEDARPPWISSDPLTAGI